MSGSEQLLWGGGLVSLLFVVLWWRQQVTRDATPVDVGWASSIGLLALFYWLTSGQVGDARVAVIGLLGAGWAFRLALFLYWTRVRGHREEDGRYQTLRRGWGDRAGLFFFVFYQVQALLAWLFAGPIFLAMFARPGWSVGDSIGVGIWLASVLGEATADAQLARFRADPASKGRVCQVGLWRYSRHPNYFFEWLHWGTYVAMTVGSPWGWLTWFAPALMLLFLFKVTGIPATEAQAVRSRGEAYREYQRTTSVFVPWFPKATSRSTVAGVANGVVDGTVGADTESGSGVGTGGGAGL